MHGVWLSRFADPPPRPDLYKSNQQKREWQNLTILETLAQGHTFLCKHVYNACLSKYRIALKQEHHYKSHPTEWSELCQLEAINDSNPDDSQPHKYRRQAPPQNHNSPKRL